ncbi:specific demethylase 5D [Seminavis robusta]|uniref:Specific demethylase 5D n=1 Tax=Seminavis robusta TaxID=568900 RepID=A0A9N8E998_9STRA|nr:specific demethylase 5D [Seminavis robusta]|eukprot:Sro797_g203900.1 specific demethylase 5D (640) ;mRNA; f:32580-34969
MEGNPLHYVEKIRPIADKYGICKIVPPKGWKPAPFCVDMKGDKRFQTKQQLLHRIQEGISFGDGVEYSAGQYQHMASQRAKEWKAKHYPDHEQMTKLVNSGKEEEEGVQENRNRKRFIPENLERDYWDIIESHSRQLVVEYGNDVNTDEFGSGFPLSERGRSIYGKKDPAKMALPEPKFGTEDYYRETWWNLNNIPCAPDSVLRHVKVGINGINVPWMYYGALFTTFCWHNEDNYLYSINYHHKGAPKQWYGVPGNMTAADGLEKVFKNFLSMKMRDVPDLLHHITTMFSPRLLQNADVPVYKLLQHEGEYVITFPRAFHGGFSLGPNVGEAVNFATHDWISYGSDANERYRSFARPAVFSHDRLTFTMANHLREQKTYSTCKLLLDEIERVVGEELRLRSKLVEAGVRDVTNLINLPKNRLDQLDSESADYDDKRLCHACKHVCFFSAVACECSQSKVSCLRHSHYMCRCPMDRKYFMIWSDDDELKTTLQKVRDHCESLKKLHTTPSPTKLIPGGTSDGLAPGVTKDAEMHKKDEICLDPVAEDVKHAVKHDDRQFSAMKMAMPMRSKMSMGGPAGPPSGLQLQPAPAPEPAPQPPAMEAVPMVRRVSQDASAPSSEDDDDEIEIIAVKPPPTTTTV